jgi:hypothetical protein
MVRLQGVAVVTWGRRIMRQTSRVFGFNGGVRAWATLAALVGKCLPATMAARPRRDDVVVVNSATPVAEVARSIAAGCRVYRMYTAGWARITAVRPVLEPATPRLGGAPDLPVPTGVPDGPVLWIARGRSPRRDFREATRAVEALYGPRMVVPGERGFLSAFHLRAEAERWEAADVVLDDSVPDRLLTEAVASGMRPLVFDEQDRLARVTGLRLVGRLYRGQARRARPVGRLGSGEAVFNTARRLPDELRAPAQLVLALTRAEPGQVTVAAEVNLRDFLLHGESGLVTVRDGEEPLWAVPESREYPLPLLPDRRPRRTCWFAVILRRAGRGYVVVDAHWGRLTPALPGDPAATPESEGFWATHALALRPAGAAEVRAADLGAGI